MLAMLGAGTIGTAWAAIGAGIGVAGVGAKLNPRAAPIPPRPRHR
jgi:hypothetical protein